MKKIIVISIASIIALTFIPHAGAIDISGIIVTDIDRPAANATITVESLAEPASAVSAVTDTTGSFSFSLTATEVSQDTPFPFKLHGNYPNPFNPTTRISYSIDVASEVIFEIYNVVGQRVRSIFDGYRDPGYYSVLWNGLDDNGNRCSAGIYLYRIIVGNRILSSKMLMIDSASANWMPVNNISRKAYSNVEKMLYLITVTHPDAETLVVGPMTLYEGAYELLTINRVIDKMKLVKANTYIRGSEWYHYSRPLHQVQITRDYFMDKYETTGELFCRVMNNALERGSIEVGELSVFNLEGDRQELFRLYEAESQATVPIEYLDGKFVPRDGQDRLPVTHVSWYGTLVYCNERSLLEGFESAYDISEWSCDFESKGFRLPTDAEWELAAAWTDRREYAYGPDPGHWYPMNTMLNEDGFDEVLSPVGWFSPQGDSHDGISDMSGNVYEWTWNWMGYYKKEWADMVLVDPTGPEKWYNKVARGGSAFGCFRAGRVGDKANLPLTRMTRDVGFRVIRLAQ